MEHLNASNFKIYPPQWDSNKRQEWPKFYVDFCSYLVLQGGTRLVNTLHGQHIHHGLKSTATPSNSTQHSNLQVGAAESSKSPTSMFAKDDDGAQAEDPQQPQEVLRDSEATLNETFYHVLLLCLKGPAHDTILHASSKTWTDAMALLLKEYGASNTLRKSKLILRLIELSFDGNVGMALKSAPQGS